MLNHVSFKFSPKESKHSNDTELQSIQVPLSYLQQSIFGPLTESVNGAVADRTGYWRKWFLLANRHL